VLEKNSKKSKLLGEPSALPKLQELGSNYTKSVDHDIN